MEQSSHSSLGKRFASFSLVFIILFLLVVPSSFSTANAASFDFLDNLLIAPTFCSDEKFVGTFNGYDFEYIPYDDRSLIGWVDSGAEYPGSIPFGCSLAFTRNDNTLLFREGASFSFSVADVGYRFFDHDLEEYIYPDVRRLEDYSVSFYFWDTDLRPYVVSYSPRSVTWNGSYVSYSVDNVVVPTDISYMIVSLEFDQSSFPGGITDTFNVDFSLSRSTVLCYGDDGNAGSSSKWSFGNLPFTSVFNDPYTNYYVDASPSLSSKFKITNLETNNSYTIDFSQNPSLIKGKLYRFSYTTPMLEFSDFPAGEFLVRSSFTFPNFSAGSSHIILDVYNSAGTKLESTIHDLQYESLIDSYYTHIPYSPSGYYFTLTYELDFSCSSSSPISGKFVCDYFYLDFTTIDDSVVPDVDPFHDKMVTIFAADGQTVLKNFWSTDMFRDDVPVVVTLKDDHVLFECGTYSDTWYFNSLNPVVRLIPVFVDCPPPYNNSFPELTPGMSSSSTYATSIGLKIVTLYRTDSFFNTLDDLLKSEIDGLDYFATFTNILSSFVDPFHDLTSSVEMIKYAFSAFTGDYSSLFDSLKQKLDDLFVTNQDSFEEILDNGFGHLIDAFIPSWANELFNLVEPSEVRSAFTDLMGFGKNAVAFIEHFPPTNDIEISFWDLLLGADPGDGGIWGWTSDVPLLTELSSVSTVFSNIWSCLPPGVSQLVLFGFGGPFGISVIKSFLR